MPSNEIENELSKSDLPQKNEGDDLSPQQADQRANSVFDFLYHDHRRIASFLAQFETYGVLQQVKALEAVSTSESQRNALSTGLNIAVGKAGTEKDVTTGSQESDSAERTYDPLWTNARTFLNYLHERNMIVRDLTQARIGQFVLVTGSLAAFDLGVLKEAWKLPGIKDVVMRGAAQQQAADQPPPRSSAERKRAKYARPELPEGTEAGFELMKLLPHTVQAAIGGEGWRVWSTLREDSLVISGSELLLKHGVGIAGQWSMLGVLDAMPTVDETQATQYFLDQILASTTLGGALGQVIVSLAPAARQILGRPADAHGATPLLIFREVSG